MKRAPYGSFRTLKRSEANETALSSPCYWDADYDAASCPTSASIIFSAAKIIGPLLIWAERADTFEQYQFRTG